MELTLHFCWLVSPGSVACLSFFLYVFFGSKYAFLCYTLTWLHSQFSFHYNGHTAKQLRTNRVSKHYSWLDNDKRDTFSAVVSDLFFFCRRLRIFIWVCVRLCVCGCVRMSPVFVILYFGCGYSWRVCDNGAWYKCGQPLASSSMAIDNTSIIFMCIDFLPYTLRNLYGEVMTVT